MANRSAATLMTAFCPAEQGDETPPLPSDVLRNDWIGNVRS
jgi:hypothetical protein